MSRKASYIEGKPGVVIVSLGDFESKQKIMKAKKLLKDKMKYKDVYIENFLTNEKRILDANNRRLLKAVGKDMEFTSVAGQLRKRQQAHQQNENKDHNTQVNNTRETKRCYWHQCQEDLLYMNNNDSKQFWRKIGNIGIGNERQSAIPNEVVLSDGSVTNNLDSVLHNGRIVFIIC